MIALPASVPPRILARYGEDEPVELARGGQRTKVADEQALLDKFFRVLNQLRNAALFVALAAVIAMVLLIVGGALYSIGGVLYALKWPNPWPTTFGHHEFFHACTAVAAICHYIAMWFAVFS